MVQSKLSPMDAPGEMIILVPDSLDVLNDHACRPRRDDIGTHSVKRQLQMGDTQLVKDPNVLVSRAFFIETAIGK